MKEAFKAPSLPLPNGLVDYKYFIDELIMASSKLEVYKEKIKDSKINSSWFMPTLQAKEALASSSLEGTQATLDGVLTNLTSPNSNDQNLNEVQNYFATIETGGKILTREKFSNDFFCEIHSALMAGNVRKPDLIGSYRTEQNYIGKNDKTHAITFIPPVPGDVPMLMNNLIDYINNPTDSFQPLIRAAIVHAQFETIHPFMDGNGRVGRMLIPLFLFASKQIDSPYFFISEALEHDKLKYYTLLNETRIKNDWNEWIKFFLATVAKQCEKYIGIINEINILYEQDLAVACEITKNSNIVELINSLYRHPITTAKQIAEETDIPMTTVNRYLRLLTEKKILYSNGKRNRTFVYADLLNIIRG